MVAMYMHVAADDNRIVVLLVHFCCQGGIPTWTSVMMCLILHGRAVIHINATVDQHRDIIAIMLLLEAHSLTGCDIVETYFGIIGNSVALRVRLQLSFMLYAT